MSKTKNALFVLYVIIMLGALSAYGLWMGSNDIKDEIFELVSLIFIGFLFLFGFYRFMMYSSVTYPGIIIFLSFVIVTVVSLIKSNTTNGTTSRNWMIGLGLSSLIPVLSIVFADYLMSGPIPVNVD